MFSQSNQSKSNVDNTKNNMFNNNSECNLFGSRPSTRSSVTDLFSSGNSSGGTNIFLNNVNNSSQNSARQNTLSQPNAQNNSSNSRNQD